MPDRKRAWVDEADAESEKTTPAFLRQSHQTPSWAVKDTHREGDGSEAEGESAGRAEMSKAFKRFRNDDLDALLSRTEPLLVSKHDRQRMAAPGVLSTLPLPRDAARTVQWHRNGQLCIVGGNRHLYTFHAAGSFVEQLAKIDLQKRVEHTTLTATGEAVLVAAHEAYVPVMVSLTTEKIVPLHFLDTRDTAVYRNGRRDSSKKDYFINKLAVRPTDAGTQMVAVASGSTVRLGALASGSVVASVHAQNPISDVIFSGPHELVVAAGNLLTVYDVRRTATFLHEMKDDSALQITRVAVSDTSLAVGGSSGVVSLYSRSSLLSSGDSRQPRAQPVKSLKNLTTAISSVCFGTDGNGDGVLAFASSGQKAAFRLAQMPQCTVIPSFPATALRHEFAQSLALAPTVPILSVGERGRVVNYAL